MGDGAPGMFRNHKAKPKEKNIYRDIKDPIRKNIGGVPN